MRFLGLVVALACASAAVAQSPAPRPDTTYTVGPDQGTPTGVYPHYYTLTRRTAMIGVVLQGADTPYAGSCRNAWCALVPSNATNGVGQSGGTFTSFDAAAHEVVRVWNALHPGDTLATPIIVPPVDTSPPIVPPDTTVAPPASTDSSYTTTRVTCPTARWRTCYNVRHDGMLVGWVWQIDTTAARRWVPGRDSTPLAGPYETTLKAAALRLVFTYVPPPSGGGVDTVRKTLYVYDTVRTTITLPPDTVQFITTDTVFLRAGESTSFVQGDSVVIPVRVLPPCPTDSAARVLVFDPANGENRVVSMPDSTFLGRILEGNAPGEWWAYRAPPPGSIVMPRDPLPYPTKWAAIAALVGPVPPSSTGTPSSAPELPRAILNPE